MYKVKKEKQRRKDKEMSLKSDKLKPQKKPFKKSSGFLKTASPSSHERAQPFLRCQVSSDYSTKVPFYFLKISLKFYLVSFSRHHCCHFSPLPPRQRPSPWRRERAIAPAPLPPGLPPSHLLGKRSSHRIPRRLRSGERAQLHARKREICDDYVPFIPSTRRP